MRILLTNDDGFHAPGIKALHRALTDPEGRYGGPIGSDLWTVAPETVQSATSHGVTFSVPLMVGEASANGGQMRGLTVDGRPADCVKLAVCSLWPERYGESCKRPDLVISGLNAGANVGINVIYSGTVAAALEAAFLGLPSIAVSLHLGKGAPDFERAAAYARRAIELVLSHGIGEEHSILKKHSCVNINIPETGADADPPTPDEPEIAVCPMNIHGLVDAYEPRLSPGGDRYYWASGHGLDFIGADPGTDVDLLLKRKITITPLQYDLTQHEQLAHWRELLDRKRVAR